MALSPEDLAQIKEMLAANQPPAAPVPPAPEPTIDRVEAPWYYVHLADGRVLETQDSVSTMIDDKQVIGRYAMSDADAQAAQERNS